MNEEVYKKALAIIHFNLVGKDIWDSRPLSREFTLKIARFVERVYNGETPEQIQNNPDPKEDY